MCGRYQGQQLVALEDVTKAANEHKRSPLMVALETCSPLERLCVACVAKHERSTGCAHISVRELPPRVFDATLTLRDIFFQPVPLTAIEDCIQALVDIGLLSRMTRVGELASAPRRAFPEGPFCKLSIPSSDLVIMKDDVIISKFLQPE
jgi:hypothetical protein